MAWGQWGRKTPEHHGSAVAGLDLNAGRARAASANPGLPPRVVKWAEDIEELPLALALGTRTPEVGATALAKRRLAPHECCAGFLPFVGAVKTWGSGRYKLDAATAMTYVAERLQIGLGGLAELGVVLPAYISAATATLIEKRLEAAKLPRAGTASLPLALAGLCGGTRRGTLVLLDVDEHALTWSVLHSEGKQTRLLGSLPLPTLGVRAWVNRLMEIVAERCVRLCRRDPRDSAIAEQSLDEQLSATLAQPRQGKPVNLSIRTEHWFQNLVLTPEEMEKAVASLARSAADAQRVAIDQFPDIGPPQVLWATATAARLPGLLAAVSQWLPQRATIEEFAPGAGAEAAHLLAVRRQRGELPAGHLDAVWARESTSHAEAPERLKARPTEPRA